MSEVFKEIPFALGYFVSNRGRILRDGRHFLSVWVCKTTGYPQVMLPPRKKHNVHRLVAQAFCQGYQEGLQVNHKDGNRANNHAENLEWVTPSENVKHAFRSLGRKPTAKGLFGGKHPTSKAVVSVCISTGEVKQYASGMDAVREGFSSPAISRCCRGQIKSHKGRLWSYVEKKERRK